MTRDTAGRTPAACPEESTLALFIDGDLPEQERREVWQHVVTCESCEEVVGHVAHLLDSPDVAMPPGPSGSAALKHDRASTPTTRKLQRWRGPLVGIAATLVAGTIVYQYAPGSGSGRGAREIVQDGRTRAFVLPSDWPDHGWSATRGAGGVFSPRETAFRAGALMVDLEVALSAGDAVRARDATVRLTSALEQAEGAEPALLYYQQLQDGLRRSPSDLKEASSAADDADRSLDRTGALDRDAMMLGKCIETARLAARASDRSALSRLPLDTVLSSAAAAGDARLRAELDALAALLRDGVTEAELPDAARRLDRIVALGGGD